MPLELELEPAVAAEYVLWHHNHPGSWRQPGGFYQELMKAISKADAVNKARLAAGFPAIVSAWMVYQKSPELSVGVATDPSMAQAVHEAAARVTSPAVDLDQVKRIAATRRDTPRKETP